MANRLLPFRQYNEHFVVNLFSLDVSGATLSGFTHAASGAHDAGTLVKVTDGSWAAGEPAGYGSDGQGSAELNAYLGETGYPHVGRNVNPEASPKFEVASGTDIVLGVTLNQTLAFDENGEKLLYYRQKALELQAVLPGEVVPVLTKGIITVAASAVIPGNEPSVGDLVSLGAGGKFRAEGGSGNTVVGKCLGVGNRGDVYDPQSADYFAGDGSTGAYYIIKIDL